MKRTSFDAPLGRLKRRELARDYCDELWHGTRGYVYGALGVGGYRSRGGSYQFRRWKCDAFAWPDEADVLIDSAVREAEDHDVYVCPMLRTTGEPGRLAKAESGQGGRHAWVDLDRAWTGEREERLAELLVDGSMVVHSGSGRHAYISLDDRYSIEVIEVLNEGLAIHLGGDAKWRNNSVLRLPGTFNHKGRAEGRGSAMVCVDQVSRGKPWSADDLAVVLPTPEVSKKPARTARRKTSRRKAHRPKDLPHELRRHLPKSVVERLEEVPKHGERSDQTWSAVHLCMSFGLDDETIAEAMGHHPPTIDKWGDDDTDVWRVIEKARVEHEHVGLTCSEARCPWSLQDRAELVQTLGALRRAYFVERCGGLAGTTDVAVFDALLHMSLELGCLRFDVSTRDLVPRQRTLAS